MKRVQTIFEQRDHRWAVVARDPEKPAHLIDTNEYLVSKGDHALLTDPGGTEIFPAVFAAVSEAFDPRNIRAIFASHQDPDVISSLGLWLEFNSDLRCYLSWLWDSFVPHFGGRRETFVSLADEGGPIVLNGLPLAAVPAHYLHSSGNFHLYDARAKILFSGDVGAALLPSEQSGLYVTNFQTHILHAEAFHRRWMGSNEAKNRWCTRVAAMDIDMLCPQHGAIYQGEDVHRFIDWFSNLDVGLK